MQGESGRDTQEDLTPGDEMGTRVKQTFVPWAESVSWKQLQALQGNFECTFKESLEEMVSCCCSGVSRLVPAPQSLAHGQQSALSLSNHHLVATAGVETQMRCSAQLGKCFDTEVWMHV